MSSSVLRRSNSDPAFAQIRAERALAAPHMGRFEPWLIVEGALAVSAWVALGSAGLLGILPYALTVPLGGVCVYVAYMGLHEAAHGNVSGRNPKLRWLNDAFGHLTSIPLQISFPGHRVAHMCHHAHTNQESDPDLVYRGPLWRALVVSPLAVPVLFFLFGIVAWIPAGRRLALRENADTLGRHAEYALRVDRRFHTIAVLTTVLCVIGGFGAELFWFLFAPAMIGHTLMGFFFGWLPHHPHRTQGRYTNTRATLYPGSEILSFGHDVHVIHHLLPRVPHHRMHAVFEELRPILEAHGTRIEGPGAGPDAPPILMGMNADRIRQIETEAREAEARTLS